MPIYNYVCLNCDNKFEIDKKMSEYNPPELCPKCGEPANRDMIKNYCNGNYIVNCDGFYGKTSV